MIRVLGLGLYGTLAASTRHRLLQYIPGLRHHGIELEVHSLLDNLYLQRRFAGDALPVTAMIQSGLGRLRQLLRQREYDCAIVHCELFPFLPGVLEKTLLRLPYLYDFDDAFYLKYRTGQLQSFAPILGRKFDKVIIGAAQITAGNQVLADYAAGLNPAVTLLPTVVDTERYMPCPHNQEGIFTVGWIGSPSTARYLLELVEPLSILGRDGPVRLVVIGGKAPAIANIDIGEIPWTEDAEVNLINTFDVGIMPLPDDQWAQGKCAFKLVQYMACGVPVVASPVGANNEVVSASSGLLAGNAEEWVSALRKLRDDKQLRERLGVGARARAVAHYSLSRNLPIMAQVVASLPDWN